MTPPSGSDDGAEDTTGGGRPREAEQSAETPSRPTAENEGADSQTRLSPVEESSDRDGPPPRAAADEPPTADPGGGDEKEPLLRELTISIVAVLLVGLYIFMISGVWPPMVAVESGSMEPNMNVNDLVFVMDNERFQPGEAQDETGVVTANRGAETGYRQFGGHGDVIVFAPNGNDARTPIIHRAMFYVEEGERWVDRANSEYLGGADSCQEVATCPAPHDGFITKGDNNPSYDQAGGGQLRTRGTVGQLEPVKAEWIVGTAEVRIPRIGWLRLRFQ